jgi:hypothetical protein
MNLEQLKQQQASLEQELEAGKAQFYRAEGALAIVKHNIAALEAEANKAAQEKPKDAEPKKKG